MFCVYAKETIYDAQILAVCITCSHRDHVQCHGFCMDAGWGVCGPALAVLLPVSGTLLLSTASGGAAVTTPGLCSAARACYVSACPCTLDTKWHVVPLRQSQRVLPLCATMSWWLEISNANTGTTGQVITVLSVSDLISQATASPGPAASGSTGWITNCAQSLPGGGGGGGVMAGGRL